MTNMDKYNNYYVAFSGKKVDLYNYNKQLIRRFNMKAEVVNAQVSGAGKNAIIAIVMKDGKNCLYNTSGQIIRQ